MYFSLVAKCQNFTVGTFCYHTETTFLRTINTHGLTKVRFPLPEVAVSLSIMQIMQTLPKNKTSSMTLKLIVIDTFIWCLFPHFHGQGLGYNMMEIKA